MAASCPTETLNPTAENGTLNGYDSTVQTQALEGAINGNQVLPGSQTTDGFESGEKRKRVETEPEAPQRNCEEPNNSESDPKSSLHPLWKTSLCSYFRRSKGSCSHGDSCRYAHGEAELRRKPDNTWDPTSKRARKMLKSENEERSTPSEVAESREDEEVMMTKALADEPSSKRELSKCLINLPMKWNSDNLRNFLDDKGIIYKSAKKKEGMIAGFVSFESAEQVRLAVEDLNGELIGNKNLKVADALLRPFEKKNKVTSHPYKSSQQTMEPMLDSDKEFSESLNGLGNGVSVDDSPAASSLVLSGSVRDVVTPLAHMPYADQLEQKKKSLIQTLKKLTRNARKACPSGVSLPEWVLKSREIGGLPCNLEGIVESPLVNGYRNKCEFSVGYSLKGRPTVGFLLGNFREGVTALEEPIPCPNVSRIACKYAAIFQEFLQHSGLPIWDRLNNTGFWRQLTVREGRTPGKPVELENSEANISEVMLIVQVCTVGFDDGLVTSELKKMAQAFSTGASANSPPLPLTALVLQDHTGISNAAPADAPLRSLAIQRVESDSAREVAIDVKERIHDYINNLCFCISPTAFFQVNTYAAEKLYSLAGDWAGLSTDTLLFDVCCGTGTIGLTLAHRVGMVVGIEMNASAVSDAIRNAEINGINNCKFVCAKAEDVMGSLLKEYLYLPQKQDEIPNVFEKKKEEISYIEEKGTSMNDVPDPEERSGLDLENGEDGSEACKNGGQELDNQVDNSCTLENGVASIPQFKNVVAIVDPPRAGLHPTVIKSLRTHPRLRRLVYISCNPESLVANAIELCTPATDKAGKGNKNNRGWRNMGSAGLARHRAKSMPISEPFRPIKAMAVDLFPHTPHCELVMLLER